jgi:cobalt-zinc-cadmium efflux system membrane fusion protein
LAGMLVKKGEIIAWLEDMGFITLQQDYFSHREKLTWLKAEYDRQVALKKENANADKQFQVAESDYLQENVLVNALQEKLALLGIQPGDLSPDTFIAQHSVAITHQWLRIQSAGEYRQIRAATRCIV